MLIFCFHHVEPVPRIKGRKPFTITPNGLKYFIILLRLLGLKIVSMKTLLSSSSPDLLKNNRQCVITFDDGYENVLLHGLPVLQQLNCPATIFLLGGKFSGVNDWDPLDYEAQPADRLLSLKQINDMAATGLIHYGSHGLAHKNISQLDESTARKEILQSYRILSSTLGDNFLPVFAYPWGEYNDLSVKILSESEYRFALTTDAGKWGSESRRFCLPRYSIDFRFSNPVFALLKLAQHRIGIFTSACQSGFRIYREIQINIPHKAESANSLFQVSRIRN